MARVKIGNIKPVKGVDYLTPEEVAMFAPSGYGLGETSMPPVPENPENIDKTGWYAFLTNYGHTGAPMQYGVIEAVCMNTQAILTAYPNGNDTIIVKKKHWSVWGEWEWVNPPMLPGEEYRTTERYMSKPVYVKLVDCKGMPGTSSKTIAHHDAGVVERIISAHGQAGNGRVFPCKGMDIETSLTDIVIHAENDTMKDSEGYVLLKYTKI